MSERIKVGDLVVVAYTNHACPHGDNSMGATFQVSRIGAVGPTKCGMCFRFLKSDAPVWGHRTGRSVALGRLKKIPPLPELEDVRQSEEITA